MRTTLHFIQAKAKTLYSIIVALSLLTCGAAYPNTLSSHSGSLTQVNRYVYVCNQDMSHCEYIWVMDY